MIRKTKIDRKLDKRPDRAPTADRKARPLDSATCWPGRCRDSCPIGKDEDRAKPRESKAAEQWKHSEALETRARCGDGWAALGKLRVRTSAPTPRTARAGRQHGVTGAVQAVGWSQHKSEPKDTEDNLLGEEAALTDAADHTVLCELSFVFLFPKKRLQRAKNANDPIETLTQ